jgi:hypothetical protein
MPSLLDAYPRQADGPITFAEPDETLSLSERLAKVARVGDLAGTAASIINPAAGIGRIAGLAGVDIAQHPGEFSNLFSAAERQTRLVDNTFAQDRAREEAYDRRIKAVKDATGIELENPERGGYRPTGHEMAALAREGPVDPWAISRQRFDQALQAARVDHPDNREMVFGNIDDEAKAIAAGAEADYEKARHDTELSTPGSMVAQFAGGMWGQRRNPIQTIGLLAGPTSAVGKTIAVRILSSGLFQGLYNAGLTALEQPSVQAWREAIGIKSGVVPATENVGMAFLAGVIPGAILRGVHEGIAPAMRAPIQRVLDGVPVGDDIEKVMQAAKSVLGEIDADMNPTARAAIKLGADVDEAARATAPFRAKDVTPELHDDLMVAAQRHGEDPVNQPSPAAVTAVHHIEAFHGSPHDFEAFDISKIGTGEGAQSYAHGLYFAENELVARTYKALADAKINGQPFNINNPVHKAAGLVDEFGSREAAIAEAKRRLARDPDAFNEDVLRRLESDRPLPSLEQGGNLYRVRIHADKERFLDWDKPISEQTPEIRAALTALGQSEGNKYLVRTGGDAIQSLATDLGSREAVAAKLREAGIPGIKYLDQGSREAGEGSRNYVVFSDKDVQITHKNDKPLSPAMQEVQDRIAAAAPQTEREAQMAASEALEDIGNRQSIAATRAKMDAERLPAPEPLSEGVKPPPASSKDPIDRIPLARDDGTSTIVSARQAARAGERETQFADLIRECK